MMLRFEQAYKKLTISKLQKYTGAFVSILSVGLYKRCVFTCILAPSDSISQKTFPRISLKSNNWMLLRDMLRHNFLN